MLDAHFPDGYVPPAQLVKISVKTASYGNSYTWNSVRLTIQAGEKKCRTSELNYADENGYFLRFMEGNQFTLDLTDMQDCYNFVIPEKKVVVLVEKYGVNSWGLDHIILTTTIDHEHYICQYKDSFIDGGYARNSAYPLDCKRRAYENPKMEE